MSNKEWYTRRNKKNLKLRTKKRRRRKAKLTRKHIHNRDLKQLSKKQNENTILHNGERKVKFEVPTVFDIIKNPSGTIKFFNDVLSYIGNKYNGGNRIFFDMSKVESVSNDALMYLTAIIKNTKVRYNSGGNLPENQICKKLVMDSGFLNYMNTRKELELSTDTNKLQIRMGNEIDRNVTKTICNFLIEKCNISKAKCTFLYDILIELMTNTIQHAYTNNVLLSYWYVFLERKEDIINIVFLDTGEGIPQTIKKKWFEKMKILGVKDDYELIQSALLGEFRTRTEQKYRGKGLPKIYQYNNEGKIKNLNIISRNGCFNSDNTNNIVLTDKLQGTLFLWEIDIKNLREEK